MSLFNKTPKGDDSRRLEDTPLDHAQSARNLPLVWRIAIKVLVSELRQMLDERDAERDEQDQWRRRTAADRWAREQFADGGPSAQRAEIDGTSPVTGVDPGGRFNG